MSTRPIRIAISGGGIAGAALFHALLKYPHLDVHIFESAPQFREAGAAIGIGGTGLDSLELIGRSAIQCLESAGAVAQRGTRWMLGSGPDAGCLIVDSEKIFVGRSSKVVQRAAFLRELFVGAPAERMHVSKKLVQVGPDKAADQDPLTLTFSDGTTHECDALIGADGIQSFVRRIVLGEDDSAASPTFAGWWAIQTLKPFEDVQACLGEALINADNPREHSWIGENAFIMHNILSGGKQAQLAAAVWCPDAPPNTWQRSIGAEELKSAYQDWPPYMLRAIQELLCDKPQTAFYLWEHPPARSYVRERIALLGDAAHATTPWQGSGAVMSLEDVLILSSLLGRISSVAEVGISLQVYDRVRRPRTQRVVQSSKGTGLIATGRNPETGLDRNLLEEKLPSRWDFIKDFNVLDHQAEALEFLEHELRGLKASVSRQLE